MTSEGRRLYGRVKTAEVRRNAARARLRVVRRTLTELEGIEAMFATVPAEELDEDDRVELGVHRRRLAEARRRVEELDAELAPLEVALEERIAERDAHVTATASDPDATIPPPRARRDIDGP